MIDRFQNPKEGESPTTPSRKEKVGKRVRGSKRG